MTLMKISLEYWWHRVAEAHIDNIDCWQLWHWWQGWITELCCQWWRWLGRWLWRRSTRCVTWIYLVELQRFQWCYWLQCCHFNDDYKDDLEGDLQDVQLGQLITMTIMIMMMTWKIMLKVIHKMRTLVELQKFKMKTGTKRKAPLPPNEVAVMMIFQK